VDSEYFFKLLVHHIAMPAEQKKKQFKTQPVR
jgi:hypothetical protein